MDDDAADALGYILALGITAAPILDDQQHPVGVVSFRDLLPHRAGAKVSERMTSPAITVTEHTSIEQAATLVAEQRADGSFANARSPLMKEDEPLLSTALAVIGLAGLVP